MNQDEVLGKLNIIAKSKLGAPLLLMAMLAMIVLPLPAFLLDVLFTFNIIMAMIVLLASIYAARPLDFAIFPTVLLVSTLLRLALNIASTRVVLLHGDKGTDAAGKVIQAFGEVVVGGNYAVGFIVFLILVIINFVVVTKGAGRISEVSARFTLDAMPGKQMGIDADLNAGLIGQDEAKTRREEIAQEADFYGSMDGASKFVRGDAIAGILILIINLIGGVLIGVLQHGMNFSDAMRVFGLLTIGDGLVAQLPSLLLSTSAAIMVTRVSTSQDMGEQFRGQLFSNPTVLGITALVMLMIGVIPGMPHITFIGFGLILGGISLYTKRTLEKESLKEREEQVVDTGEPEVKELGWDDVTPVDVVGLEVGYRLIPMVDKTQGGQLMGRIKGIRKKLSQQLGFLIPAVHIRDNLDLSPNSYRITIMGVTLGESEVFLDKELAINPGQVLGELDGIKSHDPAFNLEAVWIEPSQREQAQAMGYTVVDASTVLATHLSHLMQEHSVQLLGHEETEQLLNRLHKVSTKLAEDVRNLSHGTITRVLQNLLEEGIPIRDIRTIAKTLAEQGSVSQDIGMLTAAVRVALGRLIVQDINGLEDELPVITLQPDLEQILQNSMQAGSGEAAIEPGLAEKIQVALREYSERQEINGQPAVLLVSAGIRPVLARFAKYAVSDMKVLSYQEIPDNRQIKIVSSIGQ